MASIIARSKQEYSHCALKTGNSKLWQNYLKSGFNIFVVKLDKKVSKKDKLSKNSQMQENI